MPKENEQADREREAARKCAIEILKNCAAHYYNPTYYDVSRPQRIIDRSIDNATREIEKFAREVREECAKNIRHYFAVLVYAQYKKMKPTDVDVIRVYHKEMIRMHKYLYRELAAAIRQKGR